MEKHFLITYCKGMQTAAERLAQVLRDHGYNVWFDHENRRKEAKWLRQVLRALMACEAFIALDDEHVESPWVDYIIRLAALLNRPRQTEADFQASIGDEASERGEDVTEQAVGLGLAGLVGVNLFYFFTRL